MKVLRALISRIVLLGIFNWLPDIPYLKLKFRFRLGYNLNLKNPKTFNEKMQWLKLYDFKPEYTQYVDKYAVRAYIAKSIGEEYLKPLIAVYSSTREIDWDVLPDKFVLKSTTGSGCNVICTNKCRLNKKAALKKLDAFMHKNYFYTCREYPYKDVKPKIICEEFVFSQDTLIQDYKVFCFNGKVKFFEFHLNIDDPLNHTCDYYDRELNKWGFAWDTVPSAYELPNRPLTKKIIELSEKIATNMYFVRVDWFITETQIYFGEITLYNWAGFRKFDSYDDDLLLGSWLKLPIDNTSGNKCRTLI